MFLKLARTMKFNVKLSEWRWCGDSGVSCTGGPGAALELDIDVTSKELAIEKAAGTRLYEMGGDSVMRLSENVQVDGNWQSLTSGGLNVTSSGSKTVKITLKFPRFSTSLLYDPEITYCQGAASQCEVRS